MKKKSAKNTSMKKTDMTRRAFIGNAAAGFFIAARRIYGQDVRRDEQRLRVFKVGTGGMGGCDIRQLLDTGDVVITGLCDVSPDNLPRKAEGKVASASFDGVPRFTDYREMLDRIAGQCDAVCVSTPDHTHACIALYAMAHGKHVYVQKPLCHTFEEGEKLVASAEKHPNLATQMGNQHHVGVYRYEKLVREKFWGEVQDVHCWSDRPAKYWTQGQSSLPPEEPVPAGYNWDCWVGPRAMRPFSRAYIGGRFRTWPDFGCGAIGDMMVHNVDPAFHALQLGMPVRLRAWTNTPVTVALPLFTTIDMHFGPTPVCPNGVNLYWYEAGILPKPPPGANPKFRFGENGLMVCGTRAATVGGGWSGSPSCIAATGHAFGPDLKELQRECVARQKDVPNMYQGAREGWNGLRHYSQWTRACIEGRPESCTSRFAYSARLSQMCVLGNIAQILSGTVLEFDPANRRFVDNDRANSMLAPPERKGFECVV